jgi:hypothetical protein
MKLIKLDDNSTYVTLDDFQKAEAAWSVTYLKNEQLERENERLRSIIHKQEQERQGMRDNLEHIVEYWNRDENEKAMADALWYILGAASDILANGEHVHPLPASAEDSNI